MRKKLVFMLLFVITLTALPVCAQDNGVKLTMTFDNEPLSQVFLRLEQSSTYKFLFTYDDVNKYKVKGTMRNAKFFDIVDFVLKDTPLEYSVDGQFINVTLKSAPNNQGTRQMRTYGGYVYDEHNEPVIGAQVRVVSEGMGNNIVTVTDLNGAFTFDYAFTGSVDVQISYVGMQTVTVPLRQGMKVILKEDSQALGEVVVTGIFRKAKESYTGAVSTISSEQLEQFRGQNLLQTLKNVDASLHFSVNNLAGSNPNNLPNINIRGNASLPTNVESLAASETNNPNTPLIIMDGFEISLTKLMDYNDEEIESINILKDAAATAIYGSRGANGVIVVISKQPESGQLKVNLEAGIQMEIPDLSSYHLLHAADKLELERRAGLYDANWSMSTNSSQSDILYKQAYNQRLRDVLSGVDTDWLSKPLHLGVGQRYNLRLEGGSEEFRWSADAQYNDVVGAMKGSGRRTFNGAITLLYRYKSLLFRNYTSVGLNNSKESPYGSFSTYVSQNPYDSPYDADGNIRRTFTPFYSLAAAGENPLYNATLGSFDKSNYETLTNNFSIDWSILPELTLRGQLGISRTVSESDFFRSPDDTYYTNSTSSTALQYMSGTGFLRRGEYDYSNSKSTSVTADLTLSYNKVFADVHSFYAGLNWQLRAQNMDSFRVGVEGFASDDMARIGNARQYMEYGTPTGTNTKLRSVGVTGNINYTYASKYYVDLSYRIDGNSSYGSDKKFSSFWSSGIGWNIHHEKFLRDNKIINMLRLKASYGQTGSASGAAETDAYSYYNYITDNRYMSWMGAQLGGYGNPSLTWQLTKQFNVGAEFGLFDNRIRGTFDIYSKNTDNLLSSMNLPHSTGFTSYKANIGEVKNHGWEASLQAYIVRDRKRQINWLVGGQIVYNVNKIGKLSQDIKDQMEVYRNNDANTDSGIMQLFYEGDPTSAIYAVRSLGIDPSTGREIYLDKDGNITDEWHSTAMVYCGTSEPTYNGNLNTMFQWRDLTLNVSFSYYWGGQRYNSTLRDRVEVTTSTIRNGNVDERVLSQRWFEAGDVVFFKALSNNTTYATSRYVMDDNVLELQSVSLQYKLRNPWLLKHFKLQTIVLGVNANSLFYWGSIKQERGISYPYARNVQASVKLMF